VAVFVIRRVEVPPDPSDKSFLLLSFKKDGLA
jgi:hypothetical protein